MLERPEISNRLRLPPLYCFNRFDSDFRMFRDKLPKFRTER